MPRNRVVRVRAFAKINLSLRVLGVRADGYHELRTIFQSIALHDTLTIRRARGPFRLECDDPRCPTDSTNLIWRAASAVWKASGRRGSPRDVAIALIKRIPIAAGLGGGSSDAAAALRGLARIWRVDRERLPALAGSIGADVRYFFEGGTILGLGRGDLLFPLIDRPRAWVALVIPSFGVSTKDAYEWFDADTRRSSFDKLRMSGTMSDVSSPLTLSLSKGELQNDLQLCVTKRHPEISRIVAALRRAGASHAAMTGSGSAVFGLFDRSGPATRAAEVLRTRTRLTLVTRTLTRAAYRALAAN